MPWLIFDSHLKGGSKMPLDMPQEGSIMCLYLIYSKMLIKHQLDILKGQQKHRSNVHLRRWGSSLQGLHTLDPPLSPPATPTDVSGKGRGTNMGVPQICFPIFSLTPNLIFLWLKTPCKISEPYDNPFWERSKRSREKEEEREKNAVNSGHLVPWQRTQAARTKSVKSEWKDVLWQ